MDICIVRYDNLHGKNPLMFTAIHGQHLKGEKSDSNNLYDYNSVVLLLISNVWLLGQITQKQMIVSVHQSQYFLHENKINKKQHPTKGTSIFVENLPNAA